jgi:hypothetical protein
MRWYLLAVRAAATGTADDRFGSNSVIGAPMISKNLVREFCVNQSCTVLHRPAFVATGTPANRLMQLQFQKSARD